MTSNIHKILSISSRISESTPQIDEPLRNMLGSLNDEFYNLLSLKNGFYAFESALHFYPATTIDRLINVNQWNSPNLWRNKYSASIKDYLFFA
jgi:hypothetical protein